MQEQVGAPPYDSSADRQRHGKPPRTATRFLRRRATQCSPDLERMKSRGALVLSVSLLAGCVAIACSKSGDPATPDTAPNAADAQTCQSNCTSPTDIGPTETDADAPDATSAYLDDGAACTAAERCKSHVCTGGLCIPPAPDDLVQNGDETDVDCGGSAPNRCLAGKKCLAQSDCASDACPAGFCSQHRSCKRKSGGATCGSGEVGDPNAEHEDCCTALDVPRADGTTFKMDKYLVTAGRLRGFLEDPAVSYDVQAWVTAHAPAWWDITTGDGKKWFDQLPTSRSDFYYRLTFGGASSNGCFINATSTGAMTYWGSAGDNANYGGIARAFSQDELDTKVMNCLLAGTFQAMCAYDGGHLMSRPEWFQARTVYAQAESKACTKATDCDYPDPTPGTESHCVDGTCPRKYPWGNGPIGDTQAERQARASYFGKYVWPVADAAHANGYPLGTDQANYLSPRRVASRSGRDRMAIKISSARWSRPAACSTRPRCTA